MEVGKEADIRSRANQVQWVGALVAIGSISTRRRNKGPNPPCLSLFGLSKSMLMQELQELHIWWCRRQQKILSYHNTPRPRTPDSIQHDERLILQTAHPPQVRDLKYLKRWNISAKRHQKFRSGSTVTVFHFALSCTALSHSGNVVAVLDSPSRRQFSATSDYYCCQRSSFSFFCTG